MERAVDQGPPCDLFEREAESIIGDVMLLGLSG